MTKKSKKIGTLTAAVVGLVAAVYFLPVWPYRPYQLLRPDDGWQPVDEWLTERHCDRFVAKLRDSGEWGFRPGRNTVLITGRLKLDKELTGNYSQKAGSD